MEVIPSGNCGRRGLCVHLHNRLIAIDCNARITGGRIRLSGVKSVIHTIQRAYPLLIVFNTCLGTILPTKTPMTTRSYRTVQTLCFVGLTCSSKCCAVVGPSGNAVRISDGCPAVTACPRALIIDIVEHIILGCGGNRDQVADHTVQSIGLCEVIAVRPADQMTRIRLHIHIVVLGRIALVRPRIRNRRLGDGRTARQIVRTVSERNLDLLRSPCARQMELKVVLDKGLRVCRGQSRRENNLVELVRAQNVRKGLDTGRRAEKFNAAHIDLEVHRGDAGSRCVGDRHVL